MEKLTKEVMKRLREKAKFLPKLSDPCYISMPGKKALELGYKEDANKKPINRDRNYKIPAEIDVNHERRLKKAFRNGGWSSVARYEQQVIARAFAPNESTKNINT
jgi:hypothetical protein